MYVLNIYIYIYILFKILKSSWCLKSLMFVEEYEVPGTIFRNKCQFYVILYHSVGLDYISACAAQMMWTISYDKKPQQHARPASYLQTSSTAYVRRCSKSCRWKPTQTFKLLLMPIRPPGQTHDTHHALHSAGRDEQCIAALESAGLS